MDIVNLIDDRCVKVPLVSTERYAAIEELVDLLHKAEHLENRDMVLESVIARERTRSTGIGLGLAVPHGKSWGTKTLCMAIGKPPQGIEFESIDGKPCRLIFLLASPMDKTGPHIQALAGVSRMWQAESFRAEVDQVSASDELIAAIKSFHQ
ncbi:MAG: PTS sugar transporter subunit IIA [Planctomycetota bacterium]